MIEEHEYLVDIPEESKYWGLAKVLNVRRETIHLKHIMTELFIRRTIPIESLEDIGISLDNYMEFLTTRLRNVYKFPRDYDHSPQHVVTASRDQFFPTIELLKGHNLTIVLDFDGTITSNKFKQLYELCHERCTNVQVCTANPTVREQWFRDRDMKVPHRIHAMKGKKKKIIRLMELAKKYDYVFFVDNEPMYLDYAWLFGIHTYHFINGKIKYYTKKSR